MNWEDDAACTTTAPEIFFPGVMDQATANQAKRICNNTCTVRDQCLQFALDADIRDGIWGGKSPKARDDIRRANNRKNAA